MSGDQITKQEVLNALRGVKIHPSIPDVIVAIIDITRSNRTSLTDLVNVIEQDVALSARLISIANSGFFGQDRRVKHVTEAVVMMGWNTVKMVALGSTIMKVISQQDLRVYSHAIRTAQIATFLATEANFYKVEEISVVGLLHNIGSIIMQIYFNEESLLAKQFAIKNGIPIQIAERDMLGVDHAEIGSWTVEEWKLPDNIIESVALHHNFDPNSFHARKTAVIHVAESLALMADYYGPGWEKVNIIHPAALERLGFSEAEFRKKALRCLKMKFDPLIM